MYNLRVLDELIGKTLKHIKQHGDEEIVFTTTDNEQYKMYHCQDCCESVVIEDVVGDLQDLLHHPLLEAEEVSFNHPDELDPKARMWNTLSSRSFESSESDTWTYYKFGTIKGHVSIRWWGSSNGYYSESVDLVKI